MLQRAKEWTDEAPAKSAPRIKRVERPTRTFEEDILAMRKWLAKLTPEQRDIVRLEVRERKEDAQQKILHARREARAAIHGRKPPIGEDF